MKNGLIPLMILLFSLSLMAQTIEKDTKDGAQKDAPIVEEKKEAPVEKKEDATVTLEMQKGIVINLTESMVEIKLGKQEWQYSLTGSTKYLYKGKAVSRVSLLPCQLVEVRHAEAEKEPAAVEIEILVDTQCAK